MKKIQLFIALILFIGFTQTAAAQVKAEKFKVAGECGMCKKKIETAAKAAGATYALWNEDAKELSVKYNSKTSNTAKIQKAVAKAGYDTPGYKATEQAYKSLEPCCQYKREATTTVTTTDEHHANGKAAKSDHVCTEGKSCCQKG